MDCRFRRWEGCFSCPIFRNRVTRAGWHVQPSFTVVQSASSRDVLEEMARYFGCGTVCVNHRHDNHREESVPVQSVEVHGLVGRSCPVLPGQPTTNVETGKLRQVRDGHRSDGAPTASRPSGDHRDRRNRSDDESSEAIRGPENPQRPYADHLVEPAMR